MERDSTSTTLSTDQDKKDLQEKPIDIREFFTRGEENDLIRIGKRLAEYLHAQDISRILFLDVGARPAYLCLVYSWRRLYPQEKLPQIFFVSPIGLNTKETLDDQVISGVEHKPRLEVLTAKLATQDLPVEETRTTVETTLKARTKETVLAEFADTYKSLVDDRTSPVLVFDTCQHTGMSTEPILRTLQDLGFSDVRLGLASHMNDLTSTEPDFVALNAEPYGKCYPFEKESLVKKHLDSVLVSPGDSKVDRQRGVRLRQVIKEIFKTKWDRASLLPTKR